MRIDLTTPFAEKDAAKALGARWDAKTRNWYVVDVSDLTPFLRWMPNANNTAKGSADGPKALATPSTARVTAKPDKAVPAVKSTVQVPHCGCNVLPWEDCLHTLKR